MSAIQQLRPGEAVGAPAGRSADRRAATGFDEVLAEKAAGGGRLAFPPLFETAAGGRVSLDGLEGVLRDTLDELSATLGRAAGEAGVRTPPPIGLGIARDGTLAIDAHPQKDALARVLADAPEARRVAGRAIALKQLLEAGREAAAFQRAYAEDPDAAIARYAHLFGGQAKAQPKLLFALEGGRASLAFASPMHALRPVPAGL
jgi:hypothetical protein